MTTRSLRDMTLLGAILGLVAGCILGIIYGSLVVLVVVSIEIANKSTSIGSLSTVLGFTSIGAAFGAFFGALTGLFTGSMNGLLMGIVTRVFFNPLKNKLVYRLGITLLSVFFTSAIASLGLAILFLVNGTLQAEGLLPLGITLPAIIAGTAAGFLTYWIIHSNEKENAK